MNNTIREEIILELIERAAVILTTGSPQAYSTDCGETVLRARPKVDPEELPCVVIWPRDEAAENQYGKSKHKMVIQVDGVAEFGTSDPSVISERILGDLIKCFTDQNWDRRRLVASPASPVTYLDPYAESIVYEGGGTEAPEDNSVTVAATARFSITYWTAIGNPYE